jgi:AcrR family transcriptional regulator
MVSPRPSRPAPKATRTLTPERVVGVALDIADKEGLRAVTLGRVARELGCHVTSLYTHVESIDDLFERMALAAMTELADELWSVALGRSGDDAVLAIARVQRAYSGRHPGRVQAMHASPGSGSPALDAAALRLAEPIRAVLRSHGLDDTQVRHAHRIFSAMTRGFVQGEASGAYAHGVGDASGSSAADATFDHMVELFLIGLRSGAWPSADIAPDHRGS